MADASMPASRRAFLHGAGHAFAIVAGEQSCGRHRQKRRSPPFLHISWRRAPERIQRFKQQQASAFADDKAIAPASKGREALVGSSLYCERLERTVKPATPRGDRGFNTTRNNGGGGAAHDHFAVGSAKSVNLGRQCWW